MLILVIVHEHVQAHYVPAALVVRDHIESIFIKEAELSPQI
jgi:hypothetical protein